MKLTGISAAFAVLLMTFLLCSCGPDQSDKIVMVTEATFPPYEFREGGRIVAEFGDLIDGEPINGVVISSTPGSEVRAAAAGSVVDLFLHPKYGRSVTLLHDNGYSTDYYALEQVSVKVSERVEQGDIIGSIGTSNRYFPEPAVVFSIEQNSVPLDPMNLTAF